MPQANYNIDDLESFKAATGEPRQLAGIYFFKVLDCLFELSYMVAHDFFARPDRYKNLKSGDPAEETNVLAPTIARLYARYGYDESLPSMSNARRYTDRRSCEPVNEKSVLFSQQKTHIPRICYAIVGT